MAYIDFTIDGVLQSRYTFDQRCNIGRTPENDIQIRGDRVSRRHALIRRKDTFYVIEDLGSKNGVLVNNIRLESFVPRPLYDGDQIIIAQAVLRFYSDGLQPSTDQGKGGCFPDQQVGGSLGGLSVVMKKEELAHPLKHTTIDASQGVIEVKADTSLDVLRAAISRFQAMIQISGDLGNITQSQPLLEKIMRHIFEIFPAAERSFIMLIDPADGRIKPAAARKRAETDTKVENFEVSQTILNRVIEQKQSILSSNALQDERFSGGQSIADFSIRSLMYVPFICKSEILGVITIDTSSRTHAFTRDDLAMLTGIAAQAAVALKNVHLYQEVQRETQTRTHLSRYLSPDIVEGVLAGTIPLRLGGEEKHGTVMFCDIVGFTGMAAEMTAVQVIDKLNRYFRLVTDVVTRNSGTLHKFEGDMVMAFWNVLYEDRDAEFHAVRTGIEMQLAVWRFGIGLVREGGKQVRLGIGCNTGAFAGGNIGGNDKMEYTVIGDTINLGKRIEALSGSWQVFVAESTFEPLRQKCSAVALPPATVKGKTEKVNVFSVRGLALDESTMALCIPVTIHQNPEAQLLTGILASGEVRNGELHLTLYTADTLQPGAMVDIHPDCTELTGAGGCPATVLTAQSPDECGVSEVILCTGAADETVMALFTPGKSVKSNRTWDEMKRA